MNIPVENRMCSSSLKERKVGNSCYLRVDSPVSRENPGSSGPTNPVEATANYLCHTTIGFHLGLPSKYLGGMTSQYQTNYYPLMWQNDHLVPVYPSHIPGVIELVLDFMGNPASLEMCHPTLALWWPFFLCIQSVVSPRRSVARVCTQVKPSIPDDMYGQGVSESYKLGYGKQWGLPEDLAGEPKCFPMYTDPTRAYSWWSTP